MPYSDRSPLATRARHLAELGKRVRQLEQRPIAPPRSDLVIETASAAPPPATVEYQFTYGPATTTAEWTAANWTTNSSVDPQPEWLLLMLSSFVGTTQQAPIPTPMVEVAGGTAFDPDDVYGVKVLEPTITAVTVAGTVTVDFSGGWEGGVGLTMRLLLVSEDWDGQTIHAAGDWAGPASEGSLVLTCATENVVFVQTDWEAENYIGPLQLLVEFETDDVIGLTSGEWEAWAVASAGLTIEVEA